MVRSIQLASAYVLDELARDEHFEFICLVDSMAAVDILSRAVSSRKLSRPLDVLIELGIPGGRAGVRRVEEALSLARYLRQSAPFLRLRGLEAFEGVVGAPSNEATRQVENLLKNLIETLELLNEEKLFIGSTPIISVGGSSYFGMVAERLRSSSLAADIILRSGCYLVNDHGMYAHAQ